MHIDDDGHEPHTLQRPAALPAALPAAAAAVEAHGERIERLLDHPRLAGAAGAAEEWLRRMGPCAVGDGSSSNGPRAHVTHRRPLGSDVRTGDVGGAHEDQLVFDPEDVARDGILDVALLEDDAGAGEARSLVLPAVDKPLHGVHKVVESAQLPPLIPSVSSSASNSSNTSTSFSTSTAAALPLADPSTRRTMCPTLPSSHPAVHHGVLAHATMEDEEARASLVPRRRRPHARRRPRR